MAADTPLSEANPGRAEPSDAFRHFSDLVPVMMCRSDAEGRAIHHNEAWLRFTGRTPAEERGEGWLRGLHPDDVARIRATLPQDMQTALDGAFALAAEHGIL